MSQTLKIGVVHSLFDELATVHYLRTLTQRQQEIKQIAINLNSYEFENESTYYSYVHSLLIATSQAPTKHFLFKNMLLIDSVLTELLTDLED